MHMTSVHRPLRINPLAPLNSRASTWWPKEDSAMNTTIAYLSPLYLDDPAEPAGEVQPLLNLARHVVHSSNRTCSVELIALGPAAREQEMGPGVRLRVLPIAYRDGHPLDVLS